MAEAFGDGGDDGGDGGEGKGGEGKGEGEGEGQGEGEGGGAGDVSSSAVLPIGRGGDTAAAAAAHDDAMALHTTTSRVSVAALAARLLVSPEDLVAWNRGRFPSLSTRSLFAANTVLVAKA